MKRMIAIALLMCFLPGCGTTQIVDRGVPETSVAASITVPTGPTGESPADYVLNTKTKKFHSPSCSSAKNMKEENKAAFTGKRSDLIADGYTACGSCKP